METLRLGSKVPDVDILQLALTRAGYPTNIDGAFGEDTLRSVIRFQRSNRLNADGVVGKETWRALMPFIQGYVEIITRNGDTFWSIANKYGSSIEKIQVANPNINPQNLQGGTRLIVPLSFSVVPNNVRYTAELTQYIIDGIKKRYPFIRTSNIGQSVMGKPITAMIIGQGNVEVSYNATHHANEWITTPVLLKYMEQYSQAYSVGGEIFGESARAIYNKTTLYVVPLVNPDGMDLVTGALHSGSYYNSAKNMSMAYPNIPFPEGWKANIRGVDLNLQYPAGWENAKRIKYRQGFTQPGPRDFVGRAPLSQPESAAMYRFTRNHKFALILAYHTQGEVIYWKYLNYLPPRSYEIARAMGDASGYLVEQTPSESGYAGYKDWFIQEYNKPGYTIEAGMGVSPLPISQFDKIYNDNIGILTLGMTLA